MSARRPRRRPRVSAEHHNDERWMASYMDMVTVLMCMFIVMFAMSTVDHDKFEKLKDSLADGFGVVSNSVGVAPAKTGTDAAPSVAQAAQPDLLKLARQELDRLERLRDAIDANLRRIGLEHTVGYDIDSRGLTVHLVGAATFFASNSTTLTSVARRVLHAAAGPLRDVSNELSVEGHADTRKPGPPFPTNWELSSGRAVAVLRDLVEKNGIEASRVGAVGYGDTRPAAAGSTPAALAKNRRVDIVVISTAAEDVRQLIPALVAAEKTAEAHG